MQEKYNQCFRYARLIVKPVGLVFALVGILIFMIQYLSIYTGTAGLVIFIIGSLLWALDTLWSTLDGWKELGKEIKEHRQSNSN